MDPNFINIQIRICISRLDIDAEVLTDILLELQKDLERLGSLLVFILNLITCQGSVPCDWRTFCMATLVKNNIVKIHLIHTKYSSDLLTYLLTDNSRLTDIKMIIKLYLAYYLCTMHIS